MSVPSAGARRASRRRAESRMHGSCAIARPGLPVTDANGDVTTPLSSVYAGGGWARYPGVAFEQNFDMAGATIVASRLIYRVAFPHRSPESWLISPPQARPNDVLMILSDVGNPELAGTVLRIASIDDQSDASAIRLLCVDYQGGVA